MARLTIEIPQPLIALTNQWKFDASGAGPGEEWNQSHFDASAWPSAPAPFHNENASVPVPKNTFLSVTNSAGVVINTFYFRTQFEFSGDLPVRYLIATNYVDDGAVFYLNGVELGRLRLPKGAVTSATPASPAQEGRARVLLFTAEALLPGANVLAVEVHQQEGSTPANADMLFGMSLSASSVPPPMPDLVVWGPSLLPRLEEWTFPDDSCEVREGLVQPGPRRLLRYATETRNAGTGDLVIGAPEGHPEFVFHACHNHYHFDAFVDCRLVQEERGHRHVVASTGKASFALEDTERWDTGNAPLNPRFFSSGNQGIQRGWSDIYGWILPGQWIDVTDLPPGLYMLELELDPDSKIPELDEFNNVASVEVEIPVDWKPCSAPPPNDNLAHAGVIPYAVATALGTTECATRETSEPVVPSDAASRPGGPSVWYRWTASYTGAVTIDTEGSNFDTVLGLYRGTNVSRLPRVAFDDEEGIGNTSRLTASVVEGIEYSIVVYGFHSFMAGRADNGSVVLNLNAGANASPESAQRLAGLSGTITGTTKGATLESRLPGRGATVWYQWSAPADGPVQFSTEPLGSEVRYPFSPAYLEVFSGSLPDEIGPATELGHLNRVHRVALLAEKDVTYHIAVYGDQVPLGVFQLSWSPALWLVGSQPGEAPGLTVHSEPGVKCVLETSADLQTWLPWKELENVSGASVLLLEDAPALLPRFVRARLD